MTKVLLFLLYFILLIGDESKMGLVTGLSVKNLLLYLILLLIAVRATIRRDKSLDMLPTVAPYLVLIFYSFLTWLVIVLIVQNPTYDPISTFINGKAFLVDNLIMFLVFAYGLSQAREAGNMMKAIIWIVIFGNLLTLLDAVQLPDLAAIPNRPDGRVGGTIGQPNEFAVFLAMFIPGIVALILGGKGLPRALAVLGFGVTAICFLLTASRGGVAAIVGGYALATCLLRRHIPTRAILSVLGWTPVVLLLVIGAIYSMGYGEEAVGRLFSQSASASAYEVSSGRTLVWISLLEKMFEQPHTLVFGFGWDSYRFFPDFYFSPHNAYLRFFFETGIIGLALLLLTFVQLLKVGIAGVDASSGVGAHLPMAFVFGFCSVMVGTSFSEIPSAWIYVWAFAGAAARLSICNREQQARSNFDGQSRNSAACGGGVLSVCVAKPQVSVRPKP